MKFSGERITAIDKNRGVGIMQSQDPQNIKILTVKEVAGILKVHPSTISRYAKSGLLRSYVIGTRRLFKESDVWAFFENQVDRGCVFGKET